MATQVRETSAGKSISAWVIMNKKGVHVATVNAHYSNSGRVSVDVWNLGDAACWRSYCTARQTGAVKESVWEKTVAKAPDYYHEQDLRDAWAAYRLFGLQQGSAGGGGYDKFAAALSGLIIDGHTMADHCGQVPEAEKARAALMKAYVKYMEGGFFHVDARKQWDAKAEKIGASFANWTTEKGRFTSLHFLDGFKRLEALGYTVIQAI